DAHAGIEMHRAIRTELVPVLRENDMADDRLVEILSDAQLEALRDMGAERISDVEMMAADLNLHERPFRVTFASKRRQSNGRQTTFGPVATSRTLRSRLAPRRTPVLLIFAFPLGGA